MDSKERDELINILSGIKALLVVCKGYTMKGKPDKAEETITSLFEEAGRLQRFIREREFKAEYQDATFDNIAGGDLLIREDGERVVLVLKKFDGGVLLRWYRAFWDYKYEDIELFNSMGYKIFARA